MCGLLLCSRAEPHHCQTLTGLAGTVATGTAQFKHLYGETCSSQTFLTSAPPHAASFSPQAYSRLMGRVLVERGTIIAHVARHGAHNLHTEAEVRSASCSCSNALLWRSGVPCTLCPYLALSRSCPVLVSLLLRLRRRFMPVTPCRQDPPPGLLTAQCWTGVVISLSPYSLAACLVDCLVQSIPAPQIMAYASSTSVSAECEVMKVGHTEGCVVDHYTRPELLSAAHTAAKR